MKKVTKSGGIARTYLLSLLVLAMSSVCSAQMYEVTDLGGGTDNPFLTTHGININGQVVGEGLSMNHAFLYDNGVITDLGTLGGVGARALAVNDATQVVGASNTPPPGYEHAFLWDAVDGMQDLGTLGGLHSAAYAINNNGLITGYSETVGVIKHAFGYPPMTDLNDYLDPAWGYTLFEATGINNTIQIVGWGAGPEPLRTALYVLDLTNFVFYDLGDLGGGNDTRSAARAINEAGQAVGDALAVNRTVHAFIWDNVNGMTDLGTLGGVGSNAYAINNNGQVVGGSNLPSGRRHAFIYQNGGMQDLNDLIDVGTGWELTQAVGINDAGWIIGNGLLNGSHHEFLLTPQ